MILDDYPILSYMIVGVFDDYRYIVIVCYAILLYIYILCYVMWYYAILCYVILYNVILYYAIHQVLYYTWSVDVDPPRFALAVGQSLRASRRKCRPLVALVALGAPLKWWLSHIIYIYILYIYIYYTYIYIMHHVPDVIVPFFLNRTIFLPTLFGAKPIEEIVEASSPTVRTRYVAAGCAHARDLFENRAPNGF